MNQELANGGGCCLGFSWKNRCSCLVSVTRLSQLKDELNRFEVLLERCR